MNRNSFVNNREEKKTFMRRIRLPFGIALFLTGFYAVTGLISIIRTGFPSGAGSEFWITAVRSPLFFAAMLCAFVALIKAALDSRPFSKTLTVCMKIIAGLYLAASFGLPRIPGYQTSFQILGGSRGTLLDGTYLMLGVLLWLLAAVVQVGFEQPNDLDCTL